MRREVLIETLISGIISAKKASEPLRVGVDGVDAAGKAVLADELGAAGRKAGLSVLRASIDCVALRTALLDPLKPGRAPSNSTRGRS